MLAFALDFFLDDAYDNPDWLTEAITSDETPDLSDLFIVEQYDEYDTDTLIRVEYIDVDGIYGTGIIKSWSTDPYSIYDDSDDDNFAYIIRDGDNAGTTHAHISSIKVIERVVGYENDSHTRSLPTLPESFAFAGDSAWSISDKNLSELQYTAGLFVAAAV